MIVLPMSNHADYMELKPGIRAGPAIPIQTPFVLAASANTQRPRCLNHFTHLFYGLEAQLAAREASMELMAWMKQHMVGL